MSYNNNINNSNDNNNNKSSKKQKDLTYNLSIMMFLFGP